MAVFRTSRPMALAAAALLSALAASAALADRNGDSLAIEIYTPSTSDLLNELFCQEMRGMADAAGLDARRFETVGGADAQYGTIRRNMRRYVPVLVNMADAKRADEVVKLAQGRNTTVIFYGAEPDPSVIGSYRHAWYIGSNPEDAGQMQSEQILTYLRSHPDYDRNGNGTLDIMMLRGNMNDDESIRRTMTVLTALEKAGLSYSIADDFTGDWQSSKAFNHGIEILDSKQISDIDIVISNNDDMALGLIESIERSDEFSAGMVDYLPTFGIDLTPEAEAALLRDAMTGTVMQDYRTMARLALEICRGEENLKVLSRIAGIELKNRSIRLPHKPMAKEQIRALHQDPDPDPLDEAD